MLGGAVVADEVADLQDRGEAAGDEDDSEPILLLIDPVHDHLGHVSRGLIEDEADVLTGVLLFVYYLMKSTCTAAPTVQQKHTLPVLQELARYN